MSEREMKMLLQEARRDLRAEPHPAVGERIKRSVVARLRGAGKARSLRRAWGAVGAATTVAVGIAVGIALSFDYFSIQRDPPVDAAVLERGVMSARFKSVGINQPIPTSESLVCRTAACTVSMKGARLGLGSGTTVEFVSPSVLEVEHGSADVDADSSARLTVVARSTRLRFAGASFSLAVAQDAFELEVVTGEVFVAQDGRETRLGAGERWPRVEAQAVEPPPADHHAPRLRSEPPSARPGVPAIVEERLPPPPPNPPRDSTQMLRRAARLVEGARYAEAAEIYQDLSQWEGPVAETALYTLAQLRMRHLEDLRAAESALSDMATRFPAGALVRERLLTQVELEVTRGDCRRAVMLARAVERRFPAAAADVAPVLSACRGNDERKGGLE